MKKIGVFAALLLLVIVRKGCAQVDNISANLAIKFEVVSNLVGEFSYYTARITLRNNGGTAINKNGWELYFTSIYMLEPDGNLAHNANGYKIPGSNFKVYHINGCVFKFEPTQSFNGIGPDQEVVINLEIQNWSVARTDNMPNWWVVDITNGESKVIESTATEHLETFTGDYETNAQWKRYPNDKFDPWTPEERWNRNQVTDLGQSAKLVIPTPKTVSTSTQSAVQKPLSDWKIFNNGSFQNEANLLGEKLSLEIVAAQPNEKYIKLMETSDSASDESYKLVVNGNSNIIEISSPGPAGIYYGCQTLISLVETRDSSEIAEMTIEDSPRYGYRGMHIDVGRHFVPYEDIIKIIQVMGMYKLNKLHFHLTDDEGWRVEMPWCPYLTTVGATQCHDDTEQKCIMPQFGSRSDGTDRGSGFYTKDEYRDILRMAESHHIEVIPEVDMPGHARAAIKATEAYLEQSTNKADAQSIQLSDPNDSSLYLSVQLYTDNAVNPCQNSTYTFVQKTVQTFVDYHRDIQPLKVMHLGGDEVAHGAWVNSSECRTLIASGVDGVESVEDLGEYFVQKISEVVNNVNSTLALGLWEDGAINGTESPFDISDIKTPQVMVNAWQNIWEWGLAERAYKLANAGYKVVMSQATHLYFDHPEEPDPEERGFYWATRYASTQKTFGFMPDDLYANADSTRAGDPITEDQLCSGGCVQLEKPDNIIGIQGQIWTETVRNSNELFHAIFPRLLALAERAWHKADWETSESRDNSEDWRNFANTVGYKELRRLEDAGVSYRVPVPGAKIENGHVSVNSEFPGLEIVYSTEPNPHRWIKYTVPFRHEEDSYIQIRSNDDKRNGRIIPLYVDNGASPVQSHYNILFLLLCLGFVFFVL